MSLNGWSIGGESYEGAHLTGAFPVVSISLKGVEGEDFDEAKGMLRGIVGDEALRFEYLM